MGLALTSTKDGPGGPPPDWQAAGDRYFRLSTLLAHLFGRRVWKVSVDGGFDCPNRDGTLGTGGCRFCDPVSFSPARRTPLGPIRRQIEHGAARLRQRYGAEQFLAYFQPGTNTYAPVAQLRVAYEEARACPGVVGIVVGTRPDCLADDVLDLLAELAERTWIAVELGVQSIHDRSLEWLRRSHRHAASVEAIRRLKDRRLHVGAHVILGLPTEKRDDILATADELSRLEIDSVKLHNLYVVKNTPLADDYAAGRLVLPSREEYIDSVVGFLEHLAPDCAIDRLSGDAPPQYLIAPEWCADKTNIRRAIEAELDKQDTFQSRFSVRNPDSR
jgi:uncharacterized protein